MSKVLIISQKTDPHIPLVTKYLDDVPIIYDPEQDMRENPLTYHFANQKVQIKYGERNINDVSAVWYRKPRYIQSAELKGYGINIEKKYEEYCLSAYTAHVKAIYDLLSDKFWMSKFPAIRVAQNKLLQYEVASKLGLKIPGTMITNDKDNAEMFIKKFDNRVVMKGLFNVPLLSDFGKKSFLYTLSFRKEKIDHLENLYFCPYIFQEEIVDKIDLRITVVKDEVFACKITYGEHHLEESIDWRIFSNREKVLSYEKFLLPDDIKSACIRLTKDLGLNFGAIDIALHNNDYWFLEINPNGQWGFLEDGVSDQIAKSIARALNSSK